MPGTASRNFALRFNGNSLYTGGYSAAAGQVATNTVVSVFDGTNWTSLGEITGGLTALYDFAFLGNDLYVGGLFQRASDVSAVALLSSQFSLKTKALKNSDEFSTEGC